MAPLPPPPSEAPDAFTVPSLEALLPSALPLPVATTGLGGLAELEYRPPPGLDEKKDEKALEVLGKGLTRAIRDIGQCKARTLRPQTAYLRGHDKRAW